MLTRAGFYWLAFVALHEQLRCYREQELRVEIPPVASQLCESDSLTEEDFARYELEHHAGEAFETLWHYNRKKRPAWFGADITSYCRYGDIKDAGQTMRAHQYHVY